MSLSRSTLTTTADGGRVHIMIIMTARALWPMVPNLIYEPGRRLLSWLFRFMWNDNIRLISNGRCNWVQLAVIDTF